VTFIDQLPAGESRTVFVVADEMPDDTVLSSGEVMVVKLLGVAHSAYVDQTDTTTGPSIGLGAILSNDSGAADSATAVQNVYADAADTETGNAEHNGQDDAYDAYVVEETTIEVSKTFGVVDDPITNGGANPKAIPGATMVYCIAVSNNGSTDAANVTVADPIPAGTTYVAGSLRIAASAVDCSADPDAAITSGTSVTDTNGDADGGDLGSASAPWNGPVTTVTSSLDSGDATTTIFQVTID
jgi:uncharacterized repeat protein (TIGR01451 family)